MLGFTYARNMQNSGPIIHTFTSRTNLECMYVYQVLQYQIKSIYSSTNPI